MFVPLAWEKAKQLEQANAEIEILPCIVTEIAFQIGLWKVELLLFSCRRFIKELLCFATGESARRDKLKTRLHIACRDRDI